VDPMGRISSSSKTGLGFSYNYDPAGNRWKQNLTAGSGPNPQYSFDTNNHIVGYSYDAAGNLLNDTFHSYTYDAEGRLLTVDGTAATYTYDAYGHRVRSTVNSQAQDFIFDQAGRPTTMVNASGWARSELYAGGLHLATYVNSTTYVEHGDWVGTVRARSGVSGASVETCTSLPFGDNQNCTGTDPSPLHFAYLQLDSESSLSHSAFRQNSTTQGRWTSPDPAGIAAVDPANPQTWNRYAYATNEPLSFLDPLGLACLPFQLKEYHHCPIAMPGLIWDEFSLVMERSWQCNGDCGYYDIGNGLWFVLGFGIPTGGPDGTSNCKPGTKGCFNVPAANNLASKICAAVPDAATVGAGYNGGFGWSPADFNVSATANGVSGEYTFGFQITDTKGIVAPGAAIVGTVSWNAPNNSILTNSTAPTYNVGYQRYGLTVTPGTSTVGFTLGPSLSPITADRSTAPVSKSFTVPYVGYLMNLPKALCTATTGKQK